MLFKNNTQFDIRNVAEVNLLSIRPFVNSLLGYSALIKWLCSEAYYSSYTVYAVVLALQLGYSGKLPKHVWLVASIENLADLLMHMQHELTQIESSPREIKRLFIKYSKYLYRIEYCLYHTEPTEKRREHLEELKIVLKLRKTYDLQIANRLNVWSIMATGNKFNKRAVRQWLEKTTNQYMKVFATKINSVFPNLQKQLPLLLSNENTIVSL